MKKILTVSLVAMMAISAARAEIASTAYVTDQIDLEIQRADGAYAAKALETTVGTLATTVSTNRAAADKTQEDLDTLEATVAGLQGTGDEAAATKKELADLTQTVTTNESDIESKMTTLSGRVDTAEGKITTLTGAENVDGSVANAKKAGTDASAALNAYKTEMTTALAGKQGTISDLDTIRTQAGDALSKTEAASTYQTLANLADTTKEVTEDQKDTVYPSFAKTEDLINSAVTKINNETKSLGQQITSLANGTAADVAALEAADAELDGKISAEAQAREAADLAINTEIDAMDLTEVKSAGKAIVSISQTDGKVTAVVGEINSAGIENGTVAADDLAANSVTTAKIADEAVTSAKIADGTIVNDDIADNARIAQTKIAGLADSLSAATAAALTQLADKATDGTDGVYTLTMKQVDGVKTLVWEKIAR